MLLARKAVIALPMPIGACTAMLWASCWSCMSRNWSSPLTRPGADAGRSSGRGGLAEEGEDPQQLGPVGLAAVLADLERLGRPHGPAAIGAEEFRELVAEAVGGAAAKLGLEALAGRKPRSFPAASSSAWRWRGRSFPSPALLLDEPMSNLDARMREQMRFEIRKLHRDLGATSVYVTHDQIEAMTMADRIVAMNAGIIQQVGTPLELYDDPANMFVAGFIG